mgnify:CR=1 FL=1
MIKRLLFFSGIALVTATAAEDPTPEQQLAIADAALRLPERGAWTVTFSRAESAAGSPAPAHLASSLEATRVGDVQRDVITWPDGKTSEAWWLGRAWFAEDPRVEGVLFNVNRWPGRIGLTGWIGRDALKGVGEFGGRKVIVFEAEVPLIILWPGHVIPDPDHHAKLKAQAFVSVDERRLVRVQIGDLIADFTWNPPPVGEPAVPPRFVKRYAAVEKTLNRERKGGGK